MRRFSGLGAVVFAVVFMVGIARAHALALVTGDDDLCVAMGGTGWRTPTPVDPTDLAADHLSCCDLGLCLTASALPPSAPAIAAPRRVVRRVVHRSPATPAVARRRPRGHRPRGPPTP